jgi:hypothetical protein
MRSLALIRETIPPIQVPSLDRHVDQDSHSDQKYLSLYRDPMGVHYHDRLKVCRQTYLENEPLSPVLLAV